MLRLTMLALAFVGTGAAAAQGEPPPSESASIFHGWDGRVTASLRPTFGADLPEDVARDIVDEGEGELAVRFTRHIAGSLDLQLRGGVTFAPNYFDDDDARSALYGQVSVGEVPDLLTEFRSLGSTEISAFQDTITPYARYRYIRGYEQFLERVKSHDHRFTVGLVYQDVRGIMCSDSEWRRLQEDPDLEGLCTGDRGLYWQAEGNFNVVASPDPLRERSYATLALKGLTRPFGGVRFFAELGGEAHFYDHERVAVTGRRREDRLARATVGVDVSSALAGWLRLGRRHGLEASVGLRWERNWSNRPDKRYERGFVTPTLSLWTNF
jgi:hypothetical protein